MIVRNTDIAPSSSSTACRHQGQVTARRRVTFLIQSLPLDLMGHAVQRVNPKIGFRQIWVKLCGPAFSTEAYRTVCSVLCNASTSFIRGSNLPSMSVCWAYPRLGAMIR
jgi:hypothetical protein